MAAQALSNASLADLHHDVSKPTYDRSAMTVGIVHIGVGGFHRSHQAMYLDRLMAAGKANDWGICGVGVLPHDARMRDALNDQDGLYTLVSRHADGTWEPQVIGSIQEFLLAPDDPDAVIERMADPAVRIVSLTVTEAGYNINDATGEFQLDNPDIVHDLTCDDLPRTTFGLVVEALRRRRERGIESFTVMSCDNIQGNGEIAERAFGAYAGALDPDLAAWIHEHTSFPSSMVDRITPATSAEFTAELATRFGVEDAWPVPAEPFTQWVLEDTFSAGRPAFEDVGVQIVADVTPYELMKLRLLNGAHQGIAYPGYLAGFRLVHDAASDETFVKFLRRYMDNEATPTLQDVPGVDLGDYKNTLIERFANPEVRDTVARLGVDASDRLAKFVMPVVHDQLARGGDISVSVAIVASWARWLEGVDETGEPIDVTDRQRDVLTALAKTQHDDPTAMLQRRDLVGDVIDNPAFTEPYVRALHVLHTDGAQALINSLV